MSAAYNEFCLRIVSELAVFCLVQCIVPFSRQDAFFGQTFVAEKLLDLDKKCSESK